MTNALAIELRKLATAPTIAPSSVYANKCGDAANEIERLQAALEAIAPHLRVHPDASPQRAKAIRIVRAALKETETT